MISIKGIVYIPEGLKTDPRFILPDDVVSRCATHFNLLKPAMHGIDPMCGVGTFMRVINNSGGSCDGIEIDPRQYEIAKREVPKGTVVIAGDCRKVAPQQVYDYVFVSMPFLWFQQTPCNVDPAFAVTFRTLLKPDGFLLLDTLDEAEREGRRWKLGRIQQDYLTANGFVVGESLKFKTKTEHDTGEFVVRKFSLSQKT